jgi:hypothetical protein
VPSGVGRSGFPFEVGFGYAVTGSSDAVHGLSALLSPHYEKARGTTPSSVENRESHRDERLTRTRGWGMRGRR